MIPRLYFAGSLSDPQSFPQRHELHAIASASEAPPLEPFVEHAWKAKERLWLLDLHFLPDGMLGLKDVLDYLEGPAGTAGPALDVRILSEHVHDRVSLEKALREDARNHRRRPFSLRWIDELRRGFHPFPHDRFAILDVELWHFGYAACGSAKCLSAASGPWCARKTGAIDFYERIWEEMS